MTVTVGGAAAAAGAEYVLMKTENRILLNVSGRLSTTGRANGEMPLDNAISDHLIVE